MRRHKNPSGTRRSHTRHTKHGNVPVGRANIRNRKNKKRNSGRRGFNGTSRKVMSRGRMTKQRKKQVWSRVAWSTTGSISFMMLQRQRYGWMAFFGVVSVLFGAIDLGMTINRRRKERQLQRLKEEARAARANRNRNKTTRPRPSARARIRSKLDTGVVEATARKPELDIEYRNAEKERKEKIPVG